jgi:hypothetical protein
MRKSVKLKCAIRKTNKPTIGPSKGWRGEGKFYVGQHLLFLISYARDLGQCDAR